MRALRAWGVFSPAWKAMERLVLHDGIEIAGSMAFSTLLALFPFLIFLIAFAAFFRTTCAHPPGATPRSTTARAPRRT